jgi:hypothetical protein
MAEYGTTPAAKCEANKVQQCEILKSYLLLTFVFRRKRKYE